jgi:cyclophilin family peptidyl-prolyl cis-trans isomerase
MKYTVLQHHGRAPLLAALLLLVLPMLLHAQPAPDKRRVRVEVQTTVGSFTLELYNETPLHRDNFMALVNAGSYDSLLFHRVIPGFVVQGGHPASRGHGSGPLPERADTTGPAAEIVPGLVHKRGALAAVRETGRSTSPSDPGQFYIVLGRTYTGPDMDRLEERNARFGTPHTYSESERHLYATLGGAPHLDGSYTVFGHVVQGMEVVDAIAQMTADMQDRPLTDIRMFMRLP